MRNISDIYVSFFLFFKSSLSIVYLEVIDKIYIIGGDYQSSIWTLWSIWLIPLKKSIYKEIISRNQILGSLSPIGLIPCKSFLTVCKAIISKESSQGELRTIGLIPCNIFNWLQSNNHKRVVPGNTKGDWVNHLQFFLLDARISYQDILPE